MRNADEHPHKYRCLAAPQPTQARAPCAAWQLCSVRIALLIAVLQHAMGPCISNLSQPADRGRPSAGRVAGHWML